MRRDLLKIGIKAVKPSHPSSERIRTEQMPINFRKNEIILFYLNADFAVLCNFIVTKFLQNLLMCDKEVIEV